MDKITHKTTYRNKKRAVTLIYLNEVSIKFYICIPSNLCMRCDEVISDKYSIFAHPDVKRKAFALCENCGVAICHICNKYRNISSVIPVHDIVYPYAQNDIIKLLNHDDNELNDSPEPSRYYCISHLIEIIQNEISNFNCKKSGLVSHELI